MTARVTKTVEKREQPGFEASMERLEKIVSEMEAGTLPLEKMIERFEEGQALIRLCTRTLNDVERKIEILVTRNGETTAEPFEEASDAGAEKDAPGVPTAGDRGLFQ